MTAQPAEPPYADPHVRWCDRESSREPTYVPGRVAPAWAVFVKYVNHEVGVAVLVLRLAPEWSGHQGRSAAVQRIRHTLAELPHPGIDRLSLAGMPAARADGMVLIQQAQARLLPLSLAVTLTIFGIALGLAVDDTIHFLTVFRRWRERGSSNAGAARRAIVRTWRGMVVSSAALFSGFLVLLWSEFEAQYLIGPLLCFNSAVALVFDLAFIPSAVTVWGPTPARRLVSSSPG